MACALALFCSHDVTWLLSAHQAYHACNVTVKQNKNFDLLVYSEHMKARLGVSFMWPRKCAENIIIYFAHSNMYQRLALYHVCSWLVLVTYFRGIRGACGTKYSSIMHFERKIASLAPSFFSVNDTLRCARTRARARYQLSTLR